MDTRIPQSHGGFTLLEAVAAISILGLALTAFVRSDLASAAKVEPLEQVIDQLKEQLRTRHILRMQKGGCTMDAGFAWLDLLTDLERTADHCSNIGVCVIRLKEDSFDTHEYLDTLDKGKDTPFDIKYVAYKNLYKLP